MMAQTESRKLDIGDPFPQTELNLVEGGSRLLPGENDERWRVFIVYRGHW
jgi:hypothetical protein